RRGVRELDHRPNVAVTKVLGVRRNGYVVTNSVRLDISDFATLGDLAARNPDTNVLVAVDDIEDEGARVGRGAEDVHPKAASAIRNDNRRLVVKLQGGLGGLDKSQSNPSFGLACNLTNNVAVLPG